MIQDLPIQNTFEQDGPKHTRNLVMDIEHAEMTFSHEMIDVAFITRELIQSERNATKQSLPMRAFSKTLQHAKTKMGQA